MQDIPETILSWVKTLDSSYINNEVESKPGI